jgi:hypothetical protein
MKKKILVINVINLIVDIIAIIVMFTIGACNNYNKILYESFVLGLAVIAIINVIFMIVKEAKFLTYDGKRFLPILYVSWAILGIFLHYLMTFVDYYNYIVMYWILFAASVILPVVIYLILQLKIGNKKQNGPRVMVNPNKK